jgi:hypothetical protein
MRRLEIIEKLAKLREKRNTRQPTNSDKELVLNSTDKCPEKITLLKRTNSINS